MCIRDRVRTAMGSVKAAKLLWACDSFLNNMEPEIYNKTLVTYSYQDVYKRQSLDDEGLFARLLRGGSVRGHRRLTGGADG